MKKKVAVIFGGRSGEHEVSIVSALSIVKNIDRSQFDVTLIGITPEGRFVSVDEKEFLEYQVNPRLLKLEKIRQDVTLNPGDPFPAQIKGVASNALKVDVVFPIVHGTNGEDGTLQGLLELTGLPYVGSGVLGSAMGMDKDVAKRILRDAGIPVVPFLAVKASQWQHNRKAISEEILERFSLPCFVKPACAGSSVGVSKVKSPGDLGRALDQAFVFDTKVLVEDGIVARELEVAVLGNDSPKASQVGEIRSSHEFYSYEAKYIDENGAQAFIPALDLSPTEVDEIQKLSIRAFLALELSGLARVDFFMDQNTRALYLNEVNTLPGFTPISMYPKLWDASGLSYSALITELIRLALERAQSRSGLKLSYDVG
jgi:D-alanine-D-alanine ligase